MTDRTGLTCCTAAANIDKNVKLAERIGEVQGCAYNHLQRFEAKIVFYIALVDCDITCTGDQTNAGA